jgi:hypothetical protein
MSAPLRLLDGRRVKAIDDGGSGRTLDRAAPAPVPVNETKLAIMAVMQELDRPVSSIELQMIWAEHKELEIFKYHLVTLVKAKVAEAVYGPELYFRLIERGRSWRIIFQGAVPVALADRSALSPRGLAGI